MHNITWQLLIFIFWKCSLYGQTLRQLHIPFLLHSNMPANSLLNLNRTLLRHFSAVILPSRRTDNERPPLVVCDIKSRKWGNSLCASCEISSGVCANNTSNSFKESSWILGSMCVIPQIRYDTIIWYNGINCSTDTCNQKQH